MVHKLDITEEMLELARGRDHGAYNSMSFMDGKGNIVGFLGEYMFKAICPQVEHVDSFNHDFEYNGITVDVKTKIQTVPHEPKGYYEASVTMDSLGHQHPDWYVFCRIYKKDNAYLYGWVLGKISYKKLMEIGRRLKKGEDQGNMVCRKDCINVRYDQLLPVQASQ